MNRFFHYSFMALLVLALVAFPLTYSVRPALAAPPSNCTDTTNTPAPYTVRVCITSPSVGGTLTTNGTVTGTVAVTSGINPGVNQLVFYLDGTYLLTAFHNPWTFMLPTNKFLDGVHTLSAEVDMLDGFTTNTNQATISVTFTTNTHTLPTVGNTFTAALGSTPTAGKPFIVAAVGDGADGGPSNVSVASLIASMDPNLFLYMGDIYSQGTLTEFMNWYDAPSSFGQFKTITDPTVGSHEYLTGNDSGYQLYWDSSRDYYSFDTGGWHFISLNSNTSKVPGTPTSPQYLWLQNDLNNNTNPCTIVFYHHPYFSIGQQGTNHLMGPIWQLLANKRVTIVLNGNDHDYERWKPMDANGIVNLLGSTEFVVGTGGHAIQNFTSSDSRVAASSDAFPQTYGAMKFSLYSNYANYSFQSINGPILDSGMVQCHSMSDTLSTIYLPLIFR